MSANYWESTHHKHWLFTKDQLASMRRKLGTDNADIVQTFTLPEIRHLYIYFNQRELFPFHSTLLSALSLAVAKLLEPKADAA